MKGAVEMIMLIFCHVMSEQLLKVIACRYRVSIQKVSVVAGFRCRKLQR